MTGVLEKVKAGLQGVEKQEANVDKYHDLEKGPATYGVVKRARDNDMDIHENNPVCDVDQKMRVKKVVRVGGLGALGEGFDVEIHIYRNISIMHCQFRA